MYIRLVLPFALLALASCKDLEAGQNSTEAHKIYDEKREASPAIWRQIDQVTVNTTDEEVISRVVVTDLRPEKDGDAKIVEGGEGNQSVTIELKSPTVLRGYDFHIEVYAVPNTKYGQINPVGNNKPKDERKPNQNDDELSLRQNVGGDYQPPKVVGDTSSAKPPVPLSTNIKFNDDDKRLTRSPEDINTHFNSEHQTNFSTSEKPAEKNVPVTQTKDAKEHIHPIEQLHFDGTSTSSPHKNIESGTHLPSPAGHDSKSKDDYSRHTRDTAKAQSTTLAPSNAKTESTAKALKEDDNGQDIIYPQWHVDKVSGNTDKLLIPDEITMAHDHKGLKKDGHSTTVSAISTTTDKARAVHDTETTSARTDQKGAEDKHIQKIPSSGRVVVPDEFKVFPQNTTSKTDLDKTGVEMTPPTYAPKLPHPISAASSTVTPPKSVGNEGSFSHSSSSEEYAKPGTLLAVPKSFEAQKESKPVISAH